MAAIDLCRPARPAPPVAQQPAATAPEGPIPSNAPEAIVRFVKLVAPEFEITSEVSVPGIVNFLQRTLAQPPVQTALDFSHELPLADQPEALWGRAATLALAGTAAALPMTAPPIAWPATYSTARAPVMCPVSNVATLKDGLRCAPESGAATTTAAA